MRKLVSLALGIIMLVSLCVPAFALNTGGNSTDGPYTVVDEFDRNRLDGNGDTSDGMIDDTPGVSSSEPAESVPEKDKVSIADVEQREQREQNTSLLDTTIFTSGIFCFMMGLVYATLYTCCKVIPSVGSAMLKVVTLGKRDHFDDTVLQFILKLLVIVFLGTLFTTGYFKIILLKLYGTAITILRRN